MRILGIDCGSERTGFGVIETDGKSHRLIAADVIVTSPKKPLSERLLVISSGLRTAIAMHQPDAGAVEGVFHAVNTQTAIKLAHVRGVALCALAEAGVAVGEYSPMEVKTSVVGYGRAEKEQVQLMVQTILRLPAIIRSQDASDALAVAICHATRSAFAHRLGAAR
ncbi:MAG TPA: crossover junction endodeoxyribonuclease RuvC [Bryobacteraceae bacterium]|nr:crossover junction endodeoxyribonuclease RuvC [Bryobacteraceae bacterium]